MISGQVKLFRPKIIYPIENLKRSQQSAHFSFHYLNNNQIAMIHQFRHSMTHNYESSNNNRSLQQQLIDRQTYHRLTNFSPDTCHWRLRAGELRNSDLSCSICLGESCSEELLARLIWLTVCPACLVSEILRRPETVRHCHHTKTAWEVAVTLGVTGTTLHCHYTTGHLGRELGWAS